MLGDSNGWDFLSNLGTVSIPIVLAALLGWWKLRKTDKKADVATAHAVAAKATGEEAKATGQEVRDAVGIPNGNGNVIQMLSRLLGMQVAQLAWQQETTTRLNRKDEADASHEQQRREFLAELRRREEALEARLKRLEEE